MFLQYRICSMIVKSSFSLFEKKGKKQNGSKEQKSDGSSRHNH